MRTAGIVPSNFTLIITWNSCASLGWIMLGQQVHGEAFKLGLDSDISVSNALLALYADTGCLAECLKFFSLMPEDDQLSWNTVIGSLSVSESSISEAVKYYLNMMRVGVSPNRVIFINILAVVSSLSLGKVSQQIHAQVIKYHIADDTTIENALLACYGKCEEMDECVKILSRMFDRKDDVSWNSMISRYRHDNLWHKAMVLGLFIIKGVRDWITSPLSLFFVLVLPLQQRGMEVHASALRACLESDVVIGSALVDMSSKCGRIEYALRFFDMMPIRNVYSWNSMISGFARNGHGDEALRLFSRMVQSGCACRGHGDKGLDLFSRMKLDGLPPNHVTFVWVLSAYSHAGLVDEGFKHFKSMSQAYGLAPQMEHLSCMVDLLGRAGELDKMEDFINKMPIKPNNIIWRTVLGACCLANGRKIELGRKAADMLFEMELQNDANYMLLANMYAYGDKCEDAARVRKLTREAEVKKEAGCSWVTTKDGVHVFVSGGKSHP
ncbi:hypothetical protein LWI28_016773 [Acer negundo]|uniref:Pentatricopeptide repeat-containing protein n=1 Tax=Acer negundo TaxID=4023 RepID=A0AAD5IW52_ACENE|nr:hypothetical protein LWI28_016773 [Acer negundo]